MKVKNIIKGLVSQFDLEEINIISPTQVIFSGPFSAWECPDTDIMPWKWLLEECEVTNRMIFNNKKVFLFIKEII